MPRSKDTRRTAWHKGITAADWCARVEGVKPLRLRTIIGCLVWWEFVEADGIAPLRKYVDAYKIDTPPVATLDEITDALVRIGFPKSIAVRKAKSATMGSAERYAAKQMEVVA